MISPKYSLKTLNIIPGKDDGLDEANARKENLKRKFRLKAEVIRLPLELEHRREHVLQLNFTQVVTVNTHTWQL